MITSQRRRQILSQAQYSRTSQGARFGGETLAHVPAGAQLRCVSDKLIMEPLEVVYSRWILVTHDTKPLRGIVKAVGPGHHPLKYYDAQGNLAMDDRKRHLRKRVEYSPVFRPTQVKAGDVVELGGAEINGYAFECFYWGDVLHVSCTERDIAVVTDLTEEEARAQIHTQSPAH